MKHLQLIITGDVENTGFRFWAYKGAKALGVNGSVSVSQGKVFVDAEGDDKQVSDFAEWCLKGPEGSHISGIQCLEKKVIGYQEFKII